MNGLTITAGTGAFTFDSSGYTLAAGERLEISGEYEVTAPGGNVTKDFLLYVEKYTDPKDTNTTVTEQALLLKQPYNNLALGDESEILVKYNVEDNDGLTSTNQFTISIVGSNDDPIFSGASIDLAGATEDQRFDIPFSKLLAPYSDIDNGDVLSVEALTPYKTSLENGEYVPTTELAGTVSITQNGYEFVH